jgi:hypothetical protein
MILVLPDIIKAFKESLGIKGTGIQFGAGTLFGAAAAVGGGGFGLATRFLGMGHQFTFLAQTGFGQAVLGKIPGGKGLAQRLRPAPSQPQGGGGS